MARKSVAREAAREGRGNPPSACDLSRLPDEELFAGVCKGSEPHFNALYERYFPRIYAFVRQRVRNAADAEELTQETFAVVFRSAEAFTGRSSPLAWVYGIAKNTVHGHLRRQRVYDERVAEAGAEMAMLQSPTWSMTPEEQLTFQRCAEAISASLDGAAEWQAEAFYLRHVENASIGEICRRTHRSSDAVRSGLYRMKRMLLAVAGEPA